VATLIFALGAGVSVYEGVTHVIKPEPITSPEVAFIVFGVAFVFNAISLRFAWKEFRKAKGSASIWVAFRRSKDPVTFTVLFEDAAALMGVAVAAAGSSIAIVTENAVWDGVASIVIGAILGLTAFALARESKHLLLGEAADPDLVRTLRETVEAHPQVRRVTDILTVQMGVDQVFAALSVEFPDEMRIPELERLLATIGAELRLNHPEVIRVFVRPEPNEQPMIG
jgi:cation diffusion facilitator family transporter